MPQKRATPRQLSCELYEGGGKIRAESPVWRDGRAQLVRFGQRSVGTARIVIRAQHRVLVNWLGGLGSHGDHARLLGMDLADRGRCEGVCLELRVDLLWRLRCGGMANRGDVTDHRTTLGRVGPAVRSQILGPRSSSWARYSAHVQTSLRSDWPPNFASCSAARPLILLKSSSG